jgi:hypothetical protein
VPLVFGWIGIGGIFFRRVPRKIRCANMLAWGNNKVTSFPGIKPRELISRQMVMAAKCVAKITESNARNEKE